MYLDENILQSRTTLRLVDYIDELWEFLSVCDIEIKDMHKYKDIAGKYRVIKDKANKARDKRSFV